MRNSRAHGERFAAARAILPCRQGHGTRHVAVQYRGNGAEGEIVSVEVVPPGADDAIDPAEAADVVRACLNERVPDWADRPDLGGWLTVHIPLAHVTMWLTREEAGKTDTVIEQAEIGREASGPHAVSTLVALGEPPEAPLEGLRALLPEWRASGTQGVTVQYEARGDEVKLTSIRVRPGPTAGAVRNSAAVRVACEWLAGVMKRSRRRTVGALYINVGAGTVAMSQAETRSGDIVRRRTVAIESGDVLLA